VNVRPESETLTTMDGGDLLVADVAATKGQGDESLLTIWQETIDENRPRWVQILADDRASAVRAVDVFFQELTVRDAPMARYWTRPVGGSATRVNPGFDPHQTPPWFWCPVAACFGVTPQTDRFRWPRSVLPSTASALAAHIRAVSRARVAQVPEKDLQVLTVQRLISSEQDAQRRAQFLKELKLDSLVGPVVANLGSDYFSPGRAIVCPSWTLADQVFRFFQGCLDHFEYRCPSIPCVLVLESAERADSLLLQFVWQLFSAAVIHRWPLLLLVPQNEPDDKSGGLDFADAEAVADSWSGLGDVVQRLAAQVSQFQNRYIKRLRLASAENEVDRASRARNGNGTHHPHPPEEAIRTNVLLNQHLDTIRWEPANSYLFEDSAFQRDLARSGSANGLGLSVAGREMLGALCQADTPLGSLTSGFFRVAALTRELTVISRNSDGMRRLAESAGLSVEETKKAVDILHQAGILEEVLHPDNLRNRFAAPEAPPSNLDFAIALGANWPDILSGCDQLNREVVLAFISESLPDPKVKVFMQRELGRRGHFRQEDALLLNFSRLDLLEVSTSEWPVDELAEFIDGLLRHGLFEQAGRLTLSLLDRRELFLGQADKLRLTWRLASTGYEPAWARLTEFLSADCSGAEGESSAGDFPELRDRARAALLVARRAIEVDEPDTASRWVSYAGDTLRILPGAAPWLPEDLLELASVLLEKAEDLRRIAQLNEASAALQEAQEALTRAREFAPGDTAMALLELRLLREQMLIFLSQGASEQALSLAEKQHAAAQELRKGVGDSPETLGAIADVLEQLGHLHVANGNFIEASDAYTRAIEARTHLLQLYGETALGLSEFARAHCFLGRLAAMDGLLRETTEHFQVALGALRNAQELQPGEIDLEVELARITTELGNYFAEIGEDELAFEFLREGVVLSEEVVRYTDDSPVALYAAATCHFTSALVLKQRTRIDEAITELEAAQGHLARLNQVSSEPGSLDDFFVGRHLAECLVSQSRYQEAFILLRGVWTSLESLAQKPGSVAPFSDLALSLLPIIAQSVHDVLDSDEISFLTTLVKALDSAAADAANRKDRAVILKAALSKLIPKAAAAPNLRSRLASLLGRALAYAS
jgi:tetratricopeptide (TPR) repeat protein